MDEYIGVIKMFAGNFAPRDYMLCNGQLLPINQNEALFSIIGTTYGGDGRTTFALPNLQSRVPVGAGAGPGLTPRQLGQSGGVEHVNLNELQMPPHAHQIAASSLSGAVKIRTSDSTADSFAAFNNAIAQSAEKITPDSPPTERPKVYSSNPSFAENNYLHSSSVDTSTLQLNVPQTTGSAGGGQPHENMPPYQVINYIICVKGIYPPRP
jgi:microcystin-dependent protein